MCGFVGSNFHDKNSLIKLNDLLTHRGPDQEGYYFDEYIGLGHKRLSIIDLSEKGRQPMKSDDGKFILVFNGEIYNFQEIRNNLVESGFSFTSNSDTEVVLKAYMQWGEGCVQKFNGQFVFAVYEKDKKEIFIARDRLGIKPLYYYNQHEKFIFGSELKVILKSEIEKEVDIESLNHYLLLGCSPSEGAMMKNVNKLLPGHFLKFDLNEKKIIKIKKYWQIEFHNNQYSEEDLMASVYKKIDEAVKRRLIADVPVGAFLSGGVDSSIIVHFMSKYVKDLKTFSIKFDYDDFNESKWAKIISGKFDTDHYEIEFGPSDVKKYIPDLVNYFDDPLGDPSMIPTFLVSKVAKEHVKVSLSGTGGDELFIGYDRYSQFLQLKWLNKLPFLVKSFLPKIYSLKSIDKSQKLSQLLNITGGDFELYLKLFSFMFRDENEIGTNTEEMKNLQKYFIHDHDIKNLLNFDQNEYLPNTLLHKEDRASLGVSLETRVPFLDHELVEFVNGVNIKQKFNKKIPKYLLKKIFEPHLPSEILYRKKQGFGVPLKHYFRNELKDFAYDCIFEFNHYNYYNKKMILSFWDKHQKGLSDYSRLFWVLIMFNSWYKKWMKNY